MGVMQMLPIGKLSPYETKRLEQAKAKLKVDIKAGIDFAKKE
jgi:hypothetical protein